MRVAFFVYTADHGLDWQGPFDEVPYGEIDQCRTLWGQMPDFSVGEEGFEGVARIGRRVFIARCLRAEKWDFRGRDAVYLAVACLDAEVCAGADVERVLAARELRTPSHEPPTHLDVDCGGSRLEITDGACWRRPIGGVTWEVLRPRHGVELDGRSETEPQNTDRISAVLPEEAERTPDAGCIYCRRAVVLGLAALLVALIFAIFIYDFVTKRKEPISDRSGEVSERRGTVGTRAVFSITGGGVPSQRGE